MKFDVSAGALLLFALAYFFDTGGVFAALVPAVAIHELGHIALLRLSGAQLTRLRLDVFGCRLDYHGELSREWMLCAVLAGPAAGLVYGLAALAIGGEYGETTGVVSFLLTAFNLLPILPLDGGRALALLAGPAAAARVSRIMAAALSVFGLWALFAHGWLSPLLAGGWLLAVNVS